MKNNQNHFQVIVVGAGPAGIGAALKLDQRKINYVVLQGRLRVGGRAASIEIDDVRVDLGAWWLHSYTDKNPLKKYVQMYGIQLYPQVMERVLFDGQKCERFSQETIKICQKYHDQFFSASQQAALHSDKDMSVQESVTSFASQWKKITPQQRRCIQVMLNITERHESSSLQQLSAKNFHFLQEPVINQRPVGGYAHLFRKISQGLNIKLNKTVSCIDWSKQSIKLICKGGSVYTCDKVLVSIPLGVLKTKKIQFIPQLPNDYRNAIQKLGYGLMNKIYLSFSEKFWGEGDWISIGFEKQGVFPHFFNFSSQDKFILACFISDDIARQEAKKSDGELVDELVERLKKVFNAPTNVQLREAVVTHWERDQFSLGSYSAFHVGSSAQDCFNLRKSIDNKLWFIGEHCYGEHIGTAHGAFQTGQWAAQQVIQLIK